MMRSGVSGVAGAGCALLYLALIFYIVGFASPYWLNKEEWPRGNIGLWRACGYEQDRYEDEAASNDTDSNQFMCHDAKRYVAMREAWKASWIPGLRGVTITALILLLTGCVMSAIYACSMKMKNNVAMAYAILVVCFAAGFLTLTSILVAGIKKHDNNYDGFDLAWSFVLCCLGTVFTFIAMSLFFKEVVILNKDAIQKKIDCPGLFAFKRDRQVVPNDYTIS